MGETGPDTLLVTGGSGQVGGAFIRLASGRGLPIFAPGRDRLDLADAASVEEAASRPWSAIVNCAAYTAVDAAESDPALVRAINAAAPAILVRGAARTGTPVFHVSTDYVFDGIKGQPYVEDDTPHPIGIYGGSKAEGERAVLQAAPSNAVMRTSWVLSAGGRNFLTTMLRLAGGSEQIKVVDDQIGSPTAADDLARALLTLVEKRGAGIWHFANAGTTSWCGLARYIFARCAETGVPRADVIPIATADYPTAARRPLDSRLSTAKWTAAFGPPRPWEEAVDDILDRLAPGHRAGIEQ